MKRLNESCNRRELVGLREKKLCVGSGGVVVVVVVVVIVEKSSSTRESVTCAGYTNATSNAEPIIQITRFVEVTTFVDGMQL